MIVPVGIMRPIHQGASARTKSRVKLTLSSNQNGAWHVPTPWGYERYCSDNRGGDDYCFFLPLGPGPNRPSGFLFGLLLDLDRGTLSIYVNGRRDGTVKRGLSGYYRWTAFASHECPTVKIELAPVPVAVPDA